MTPTNDVNDHDVNVNGRTMSSIGVETVRRCHRRPSMQSIYSNLDIVWQRLISMQTHHQPWLSCEIVNLALPLTDTHRDNGSFTDN